jgi:phosphate transport system substrate-binding protein
VLLGLLSLLAAGCSGGGTTAQPTQSSAGSATAAPSGGGGNLSASLVGAGASFPEPLYMEWIGAYKKIEPGVSINYQGIGSSGGRQQFIAQQLDFAGSDAPMNDEEIAAAQKGRGSGSVLHIPMVFGGVAIAYNIPGLKEITLDGDTIAKIFLGQINNINDPAIAALNPGVQLPNQPLTVVHRSDGSGTTSIFTTYLTDVNDAWKNGPGKGSEINWPTGVGGDKNDGVASAIAQQPGGIGYVSYEFAVESNLVVAKVKNADGNAVAPSTESITAAADKVTIPDDLRFSILGIGGQGYPIVGATWILAYTSGYDNAKADALKAFLTWSLKEGDQIATELNYAPIGDSLQARALRNVERINSGS